MSDEPVGQVPASADDRAPDGLEVVTEEVLPALIARLRASRLGELEVRSGGWRVRLHRDPSAPTRSASGISGADGSLDETASSVARSPAVGYFSPAPDLVVGSSVQAADVLGTIDVLGITQEVTAPESGIVAHVLVEEGQAVEYGQALADIDRLDDDLEDAPPEAAG